MEREQYRNTVNRIAFSLLMFLVLITVRGYALTLISFLLSDVSEHWFTVIYELTNAALYIACFLLPIAFFRLASKGKAIEPVRYEMQCGRELPLYLLIGLALISAAAVVNARLVSLIDVFDLFGAFSSEAEAVLSNEELVLQFFTLAVVPAFVEEVLFRGVILSNLLPFGRTGAIFVSALLFGLMHQNLSQLLYATVAGLILGYLYVKMRSIWPCVLLHFTNNFYSLIRQVLYERLADDTATGVILAIQAALFAGGILSCFLLLRGQKDARAELYRRGAFERDVAPHPDYAEQEIAPLRQLRLSFTPLMLAFVILSVSSMLAYLLL